MAKHLKEVDLLAAVAAVLCVALGFLSRQALNPDGVSYLDLAGALQRGDWSHFVQGYWSPLLPLLTGGGGLALHREGPGLVPIAHWINLVAALGAVLVLWRWGRRDGAGTHIGRACFAAFLICSAGLPRIEAVTPDIILLFVMTWLSYELIVHGGRRWLLVGALLGISFLTKTSSWPWLLAAIPLRLWAATTAASRRQVAWSTLACIGITLTWIVPMSLKYRAATMGSAGTLNYGWYIAAHSSRLPDTDRGTNSAYQNVGVGNGRLLTVATFDDAGSWTYQPWGDPTEWATKVLTQTGRDPTPFELVTYWLRLAGRIFGLWLGPLIVCAMLPWVILRYRRRMTHELITTQRDALVVMLLGVIGLLQFAAVHAEPRLIAPFGLMMAIGTISWCFMGSPADTGIARFAPLRHALAWLGMVAVLVFAVWRFSEATSSAAHLREVTTNLDELRRRIAMVHDGPIPIAVVGPAAPIMAAAFWVNAHVAMQVAPPFADLVATLPKQQQDDMLFALFRGKVPMIWRTSADGGMEMLVVPPN